MHWFFLRPLLDLSGGSYVVDKLLHVVVPAAGGGCVGRGRTTPARPLAPRSWDALLWPLLWGAFTLVRGSITGWWPYPFINVDELGWGRVLVNLARRRGPVRRVGAWPSWRPTAHWHGGHRLRMSDNGAVTSPRTVAVLGSTGSIGTQALDVIARNPDRFRVVALSAGTNLDLVAEQAVTFDVDLVAVARGTHEQVAEAIGAYAARAGRAAYRPQVVVGDDAAVAAAGCGADVVLNGITGAIGLRPTLAALAEGSALALANKESLIVGGPLVKAAATPTRSSRSTPSTRPSPSRCGAAAPQEVRRLVVTASGGPFRGRSRESLRDVTPPRRWPTRTSRWGG